MTGPDAHPTSDSAKVDEGALLRRVVQLACDNADAGRLPFGALVVRDGSVLATGVNTAMRDRDPTAHAEVAAATGVERILYAAPREAVPDLGYPAPPGVAELMTRMQDVLRATAPDQLVYVKTDGAEEPFRRFLSGGAGR